MPAKIVRVSYSLAARRERAQIAYVRLGERHPDARCALNHRNAFELLVATVLSAQTTDQRVNAITPALFTAFPSSAALAKAPTDMVENLIRSLGFFRAKTKQIIGLAQALEDNFAGQIPSTLSQLVTLPGVGRKTANVVLGDVFGVPGLTVDTHEGRVARRLGLTKQEDPKRVEEDLGKILEPKQWTNFNHRVIFHGRRVCHSRKAACGACVLQDFCPSAGLAGPLEAEIARDLVRENATSGATILPAT